MSELLEKYRPFFSDIPELYDYQQEVLARLGNCQNTLAIVPTGGGKSLIYQIKALDLTGVTLVICPLVALMEEQVKELNDRGIKSLALNGNLSFEEQRSILRKLDNSYKLIYLSAERLHNSFFRAALLASGVSISMVVVDEAHCISQWGSGFRPEYAQIKSFLDFLKDNSCIPIVLCLTATMSNHVRGDIALEFNVADNNIIVKDIIRENLVLHTKEVDNEDEKEEYLRDFLKEYNPQKSIAYLYSKKKCEEYAELFSDEYVTDYFHAGVDADEKGDVYTGFLNSDIQLLFATTAFGMGINIPDIESVIHLQIPNSVEEYYQQVGRGWRKKTEHKICNCLVLWSETNFDRREKEIFREKYDEDLLNKAFKMITGGARIKKVGQVVNKEKSALLSSDLNLQLIRYKLEKYNVIRTIAEVNGSPKTIELNKNTALWSKVFASANEGMDSFNYVSKDIGVPVKKIIDHLFEQDIQGNIKKLPAMKKDIYFEILELNIPDAIAKKIISEINEEVDFRLDRLRELRDVFKADNMQERISELLA